MIAFLQANWAVVLLVLSEVLPFIPGFEANSVGQLVMGLIKQALAKQPAK